MILVELIDVGIGEQPRCPECYLGLEAASRPQPNWEDICVFLGHVVECPGCGRMFFAMEEEDDEEVYNLREFAHEGETE